MKGLLGSIMLGVKEREKERGGGKEEENAIVPSVVFALLSTSPNLQRRRT